MQSYIYAPDIAYLVDFWPECQARKKLTTNGNNITETAEMNFRNHTSFSDSGIQRTYASFEMPRTSAILPTLCDSGLVDVQ